jgi:magnesium-transporting ATPase (P-type)
LVRFYLQCICILQVVPQITITNGIPTTAIPLAFVISFDGIVTAREDYLRHKDDARANARPTQVLRGDEFVSVQWRDIKVGDIVKVWCSAPPFVNAGV